MDKIEQPTGPTTTFRKPRVRRRWPWIVGGVIALLAVLAAVFYFAGRPLIIRIAKGELDRRLAEVSEAIFQQTGRNLPESDFTLPDIKTAGSFECTVRLHPEVTGTFTVVVQKEKLAGGKDAAAVGKAPAKRR